MTDNLKDKILKDIREGRVHMRPRAYFALQVVALVLVAFAALVVSVFILNFIVFTIRLNRADMLLGQGLQGWLVFVGLFPWALLILDVLLVLVLELLLRKFQWGYKVPALYLLLGLLVLTVVAGVLVDRATPLNDQLWRGQRGLPPPLRDIYGHARHHDFDDSLRRFGIPPGPDVDDASSTDPVPPPGAAIPGPGQ